MSMVEAKEMPAANAPLLALQTLGQRPPFFCVHSIGGGIDHMRYLADGIGQHRPFFVLRVTAKPDPSEGIEQMAARYVTAVLARQPVGPHYLGGYSFGGTVAYEMARQMTEQGRKIGMLAIIEDRWPGWRLTPGNALPTVYQWVANMPGFLRGEAAVFSVTRLIGQFRRALRSGFHTILGLSPRLDLTFDLSRHEPEMHSGLEAHFRALVAYKPRRCVVPIEVFRANVQRIRYPCHDAALGWGIVADGAVIVHRIPGNHVSMVAEPHVRKLAEALSKALDRRDTLSL